MCEATKIKAKGNMWLWLCQRGKFPKSGDREAEASNFVIHAAHQLPIKCFAFLCHTRSWTLPLAQYLCG